MKVIDLMKKKSPDVAMEVEASISWRSWAYDCQCRSNTHRLRSCCDKNAFLAKKKETGTS